MSVSKKNCLLVYRNKKVIRFDEAKNIINDFSAGGYYFDKIDFISYDSPADIVRSIKTCNCYYENTVILCPQLMQKTLTDFIEQLTGAGFDEFGVLKNGFSNYFMLFSDCANRLKINDIINILNKKYSVKYSKAFIKTVGAPAEKVNSAIAEANTVCKCDYGVYEDYGDCKIELTYDGQTSKAQFDEAYRLILKNLNDYVYAIEDVSLCERLVQLLKLRRMKISVAESFTGGGICKRLVEIPGVSEVFYEGLNTYSNQSKCVRLGVREETLIANGAVSEKTAYEMAEGLLQSGGCNVSIATTGIAGPKSDNTRKPVGLNYIAIGCSESIKVYKFNLKGNRKSITETAINTALFLAYKTIK